MNFQWLSMTFSMIATHELMGLFFDPSEKCNSRQKMSFICYYVHVYLGSYPVFLLCYCMKIFNSCWLWDYYMSSWWIFSVTVCWMIICIDDDDSVNDVFSKRNVSSDNRQGRKLYEMWRWKCTQRLIWNVFCNNMTCLVERYLRLSLASDVCNNKTCLVERHLRLSLASVICSGR